MKKNIRTIAALVLALCMVFALTACGGEDDPTVLALDGTTYQSISFNGIDIEEFAVQAEIPLEEIMQYWSFDGNTITVTLGEESASSEYETIEGGISFDGYNVAFDAENELLGVTTVSNGVEVTMVFARVA